MMTLHVEGMVEGQHALVGPFALGASRENCGWRRIFDEICVVPLVLFLTPPLPPPFFLMSRVPKAQPTTISANDLAFITSLAQAPLRRALSGTDAPPTKDTRSAAERKEFMLKLDTQKLKDKVEKGAADEEQIQQLASEMCECLLKMFFFCSLLA